MKKPELKLVVNNATVKRTDRVINIWRLCKENKIRLRANKKGGFYQQPTSPDAA